RSRGRRSRRRTRARRAGSRRVDGRRRARPGSGVERYTAHGLTVQLFHTCLVNEIDPDVGMAVVRVLERAGAAHALQVAVPLDETCCGQPAFNAGFHDDARTVARHTLKVLDATDGPIVIPSGSCADMLVHQSPELFEHEPETLAVARRVAARCREL